MGPGEQVQHSWREGSTPGVPKLEDCAYFTFALHAAWGLLGEPSSPEPACRPGATRHQAGLSCLPLDTTSASRA